MNKTAHSNPTNTSKALAKSHRANSRPVLGRLIGLETEYGLYVPNSASSESRSNADGETLSSDCGSSGHNDSTSHDDNQAASTAQHVPCDENFVGGDRWFLSVASQIRRVLPTAPSRSNPRQMFLANGGSISFEPSIIRNATVGLVESATPECRSPMDLVTSQAALDHLVSEVIDSVDSNTKIALVKNCNDAFGNQYGQQENYEVEIATGFWLMLWRVGLLLLLPLLFIYKALSAIWLGSLFLVGAIWQWPTILRLWQRSRLERIDEPRQPLSSGFEPLSESDFTYSDIPDDVATLQFHVVDESEFEGGSYSDSEGVSAREVKSHQSTQTRKRSRRSFFAAGCGAFVDKIGDGNETPASDSLIWLSPRLLKLGANGLRLLHHPIALVFHCLIVCVALRPQRKLLTGWLAARHIIDGAGYVDQRGLFWLSSRVTQRTCVIGVGRYWNENPVFVTGHWLEELVNGPFHSLVGWRNLWRSRQRVQIALGDSTPNANVEYLRIGVTALLLDLVENGDPEDLPVFKNPITAMKRFARDEELLRTIQSTDGKHWTAIEIHQFYIHSMRRFLQKTWQVPAEAWQILHLWQTTLDDLEAIVQTNSNPHDQHTTTVDWLSKKWLLSQVEDASLATKQKIDIRYHELSDAGYFRRLRGACETPSIVDASKLDRALRNPPPNTPATKRGYLIREFHDSEYELTADWTFIEMDNGIERQRVSL